MATPVITDGLVANWESKTFTSGTQWVDSVNGLVINFTSSPSKSGAGIELNAGITFQSQSLSSLGLSQPVSIEWIGRIDAGSFNSSSPGNVFGFGPNAGAWDNAMNCYSHPSNGIQMDLDSSGTIKSGNTGYGNYHIVVRVSEHSWIATTTCDLYVNGTTQHHYSESNLISRNDALSSDKTYVYNNEGVSRFVGAVNFIRIWNKELSDSEIQTMFTDVANYAHLKQSGMWNQASRAYKKQNGVWVEVDSVEGLLDSNTKYV